MFENQPESQIFSGLFTVLTEVTLLQPKQLAGELQVQGGLCFTLYFSL